MRGQGDSGGAGAGAYGLNVAPFRMVFIWLGLTALCSQLYFITFDPLLGWAHLVDDQMISMRVARHLALTGEPFYNLGDPVAANTSLFWMYPLALAHLLAKDPDRVIWLVFWVSTAAFAGLAVWISAHLRNVADQALCLGVIALSSAALIYGGSGWEHVPETILTSLGFLQVLKDQSRAAWLRGFYLASFAFLVRPDAAPVIAVLFLAALLFLSPADRRWFLLRSLPALCLPAAYVALMLHFYGDVVPNTFYLKDAAAGSRLSDGLSYLVNPLRSGVAPILGVAMALFWRKLTYAERVICLGFWAQAAYVAWVGGDVFKAGRFFLIYLPVMTLVVVKRLGDAGLRALCVLSCFVLLAGGVTQRFGKNTLSYDIQIVSQLRLADLIQRRLSPSDGAIGVHFLGIGYRLPEFQIVDFYGKADPVIARSPARSRFIGHNKWDYDHSIDGFRLSAVFIPDNLVVEADHPARNEDEAETSGFGLIDKVRSTGRFTYLSPSSLCVESSWGLFLRNDLAADFQRAACAEQALTPPAG